MTSSSSSPSFAVPPPLTSPPPTSFSRLAFPAPYVLLVTLSRPRSLNCINLAGHRELDAVWAWLDSEPSLRVGIVTGEGRAFCAGADLKEWATNTASASSASATPKVAASTTAPDGTSLRHPASGFGALSTRTGRKPVIAAVNGLCLGGGFEMIINCDLVLASASALFGLPEAKRGVVAVAGALPRLARVVGRQRAGEMAMTGRSYSALTMAAWGVVNAVVDDRATDGGVVAEAVRWASEIADNSPDSVIVSRQGVLSAWDGIGAQEGTERTRRDWFARMEGGENMAEGLTAFVEKRAPRWVPSKL